MEEVHNRYSFLILFPKFPFKYFRDIFILIIMALLAAEEKPASGKCVMCGGKMERGNLGFICNTCKDNIRQKK